MGTLRRKLNSNLMLKLITIIMVTNESAINIEKASQMIRSIAD